MKNTLHRIWGLALKEFLQLFRDKLLLSFVLIAPILELLLMGGLAGGGVENLPLAIVDLDRSAASRALTTKLAQAEEFMLQAHSDSVAEAQAMMQTEQVDAIVVIPPDYGQRLLDPVESAELQVISDGSSYVPARVASATAEEVAAEITQELVAQHALPGGGPIDLRFTARFNEALDDKPHSITAMLGLIVYQVTLIIAAQSFTRERELGTLEQLRVTPLGRLELMIGKAIPTLIVGLVNGLLMLGFIVIWFGIPMRGSLILLALLTIPFILAQIGWGTLISLVSRTQQQAILFVFALAMLEVACSGFMVPLSDMPPFMQGVALFSSVQHYLVIMRGVMLRGAGLSVLWLPGLALVGISLAVSVGAWVRLRLGLDADSLRQRLRERWTAWCAERRARREAKVLCPRKVKKRKLEKEPV